MMFTGTTTVLGAGNTFVGPTMLANTEDNVTGTVFADQAGNIFVEQSGDGVNWDLSKTIAYVASSTATVINETIVAPFVRVRFTNTAGSAQTIFRLFIDLRSSGVKP